MSDDLDTARGCMTAVLLGLVLWGFIIYAVWRALS